MEDPTQFPAAVRELVPDDASWAKLEQFAQMLQAEGELRGLIGPRELPRLWSRHLINSLAISGFIPDGARVGDVGSGAGFPGIVLAIARPHVDVTLIETMERRCDWLNHVTETLTLPNVTVLRGRAEEYDGAQEFAFVTARAVAALDKLLRWTWPLVAEDGAILAMKGGKAAEEIDAAQKVLRKFKVAARLHEVPSPLDGSTTNIVEVRRRFT